MSDAVKLKEPSKAYRSKVWEYYGFRASGGETPTCKLCFKDILCKSGNTTNLATHLKRKHNIDVSSVSKSKAAANNTTNVTKSNDSSRGSLSSENVDILVFLKKNMKVTDL